MFASEPDITTLFRSFTLHRKTHVTVVDFLNNLVAVDISIWLVLLSHNINGTAAIPFSMGI